MSFFEIEFPLARLSSETVEAALLEIGAESITFVDRGDEPVLEPKPGEFRLWSDTLVRALFHESHDAALSIGFLTTRLGAEIGSAARVRAVKNQDWERVWLADWKSMRFGRRLWVCPHSADTPPDADAVIVRLDPGLAFGTGTHPTTALCLQILDSLPLAGRTVIDYGCGSGILGIAALKLGAAHVTAVDLDPQALIATRDNAAANGVAANIDVRGVDPGGVDPGGVDPGGAGPAGGLQPAYCLLANILAGPLIELAPILTRAVEPGGCLVLSGLLKTQAFAVKAAYGAAFAMVQVVERDEWCCIYARRGA